MKILRYLIFLSILSSIFFVIYRQSDQKGFRRCLISFKAAVLFAASAAGLIPLNTEAIESPGNNNPVYQERLLSDQKVILVKAGDSSPSVSTSHGTGQPSNFPTPPAGGRPSRPVHVPKYRTAPKVVPGPGLGAGANPAGAGGGGGAAEFDDQFSVPENKKSQESKSDYDYSLNAPKKKKQSAEQCKLGENVKEIVSKIKEDAGLVRAAKEACKNADVQKDINHLEEELAKGNSNPGIGRKPIGNGIIEHRGKNGGRVYIRESDSVIEILAKSGKKKTNQQFVINRLKQIYG